MNRTVWCKLGLITKRKSHATSASQKHQCHMHTHIISIWRLVVPGFVFSCKMAYEGETKMGGSMIYKPPVCTSMLWKGRKGIQSSLLLPPSPFAGKMVGSVFRRLILFFFSMVACGQEERGNISRCLEDWMERWPRHETCTFLCEVTGSRFKTN
jgi:hypothetical protein